MSAYWGGGEGGGGGSIRLELAYLSAWFNAMVHSCGIGVNTARGGKGSAILTLSDSQVSKSLLAYQLQCRCCFSEDRDSHSMHVASRKKTEELRSCERV